MAKRVIKQTKRRFKPKGFLALLAFMTVLLSGYSAIFARLDNNALLKSIQDTQKEINVVIVENESLKVAVQELQNYARVVSIAKESGLESLDNTITVRQGE